MSQLLLRPHPRHSLPILVLVAAGDVLAIALAAGFLAIRNWSAVIFMLAAALTTGGATWAYFARASLGIEGDVLVKRGALGITSRCRVEDLARMETSYAPQPTVRFIRQDGSLAFRMNARPWTADQLDALRVALRLKQS